MLTDARRKKGDRKRAERRNESRSSDAPAREGRLNAPDIIANNVGMRISEKHKYSDQDRIAIDATD
jgi:hypothetical protein